MSDLSIYEKIEYLPCLKCIDCAECEKCFATALARNQYEELRKVILADFFHYINNNAFELRHDTVIINEYIKKYLEEGEFV